MELRPALDALFDLDEAMAEVVASATQPALAAIKLAWWREALERLDHASPPAEPRLQAIATELLPRGVTGAELAKLEEAWASLLQPQPDWDTALARGTRLFAIGARLLGAREDTAAGRVYAAGDLTRRGYQVPQPLVSPQFARSPKPLRPLTALAALARRDLRQSEAEATPARAWTILRHRLTGR